MNGHQEHVRLVLLAHHVTPGMDTEVQILLDRSVDPIMFSQIRDFISTIDSNMQATLEPTRLSEGPSCSEPEEKPRWVRPRRHRSLVCDLHPGTPRAKNNRCIECLREQAQRFMRARLDAIKDEG